MAQAGRGMWSHRSERGRGDDKGRDGAMREPSNFIGVHSTRPLARTTEKRSGVGAVACPCSATPGGARVLDDCRGFPLGWRRIEAERRGLRDI
ncbi:unnamed protein product [Lampetra planeri]